MSKTPTPGERLRDLRIERGLTQSDLARLIDVEVFTISRLETGRNRPSERTALALQKRLGIPVEEWRDSKAVTA